MNSSWYRQHRTRPCKKRKSGAPTVSKRERKNNGQRAGQPSGGPSLRSLQGWEADAAQSEIVGREGARTFTRFLGSVVSGTSDSLDGTAILARQAARGSGANGRWNVRPCVPH